MLLSTSPKPRSPVTSLKAPRTDDGIFIHTEAADQIVITLNPRAGEGVTEIFARLASALNDTNAAIAQMFVFGSLEASASANGAMRRVFGRIEWPVTWIEGAACAGNPIAGVQTFAVTGCAKLERIEINGRIVGSVFESGRARHCMLGDLGPREPSASRGDQTKQALEMLQVALAKAGLSLADTIRTWFFLDDILSWYDEFNRARTEIYSNVKFRSRSLPASTGVGARNPSGAALAVGAWAVRPLSSSSRVEEVASPLQCPAPCYGSSFSRAMEISSTAGRQLLISGTASIEPGGATAWRGDARKQIKLTMDVVEKILQSRGLSLDDLTRVTAYFKYQKDAGLFAEWSASRELHSLPVIVAQCDICRDDLLFELEADAWGRVQTLA